MDSAQRWVVRRFIPPALVGAAHVRFLDLRHAGRAEVQEGFAF